jgi:hypothetical protein
VINNRESGTQSQIGKAIARMRQAETKLKLLVARMYANESLDSVTREGGKGDTARIAGGEGRF